MAAARCTRCNLNWPVYDDYERCPGCDALTWIQPSATPMEVVAARVTAAQLRFERFYWEEWDAERQRRGDPAPESLGALEAARQIAEVRKLEAAL